MQENSHSSNRFKIFADVKFLIAGLIVLLLLLQYQLWFAEGGYRDVRQLKLELQKQHEENAKLRMRNQKLEAEVEDLKRGLDVIEELARKELGMIKEGETFYQIIDNRPETSPAQ